jgi:CrcB protein
MRSLLIVALGGALGAAARYAFGGWVAGRAGDGFPWGTMVVNVSGAFLIGLVLALSLDRAMIGSDWRLFLTTGILGGYTTFSTLSFEPVALMETGSWVLAAANMLGSAGAGVIAVMAGLVLGRVL